MALGAAGTGSIAGLAGHPVERITVENVRISAVGAGEARGLDVPEREADYPKVTMYGRLPAFGLYLRHARDVVLRDIELTVENADPRPALIADDVAGLHLAGLRSGSGNDAGPVVWLNDIRGGLVYGNLAPQGVGVFLRVTGESTQNVALAGNAYWTSGPVELAPEIGPEAVMQIADTGGDGQRAMPRSATKAHGSPG